MPLDKDTYAQKCRERWDSDPLRNAIANWERWQSLRGNLIEAMQVYLHNPHMIDLAGKEHANGTLTDFLWKTQTAWQPDRSRLDPLLDFCNHYQKVFLRRGLLIYCELLLQSLQTPATTEPTLF